jgi:hypothetical protein
MNRKTLSLHQHVLATCAPQQRGYQQPALQRALLQLPFAPVQQTTVYEMDDEDEEMAPPARTSYGSGGRSGMLGLPGPNVSSSQQLQQIGGRARARTLFNSAAYGGGGLGIPTAMDLAEASAAGGDYLVPYAPMQQSTAAANMNSTQAQGLAFMQHLGSFFAGQQQQQQQQQPRRSGGGSGSGQ